MKKTTFTRYGVFTGWSQSTGYLLTHSVHPGRKFALARGSERKNGEVRVSKDRWALFDVESGYCIESSAGKTREKAYGYSLAFLSGECTPEWLVKWIERARIKHAELELRQTITE